MHTSFENGMTHQEIEREVVLVTLLHLTEKVIGGGDTATALSCTTLAVGNPLEKGVIRAIIIGQLFAGVDIPPCLLQYNSLASLILYRKREGQKPYQQFIADKPQRGIAGMIHIVGCILFQSFQRSHRRDGVFIHLMAEVQEPFLLVLAECVELLCGDQGIIIGLSCRSGIPLQKKSKCFRRRPRTTPYNCALGDHFGGKQATSSKSTGGTLPQFHMAVKAAGVVHPINFLQDHRSVRG
jgi:hypothetical protein